ncbi:MAG: hypothetical protein ABI036_08500, partial [Fibrobacteria bacterium]
MLNLEQCLFPGTPVNTLLRLRLLTDEHREFAHEFIPAISARFTDLDEAGGLTGRLHSLSWDWPDFSASIAEHFELEESYLFPKILRYEYC